MKDFGTRLKERSNGSCELCGSKTGLDIFYVAPNETEDEDGALILCEHCRSQLESPENLDQNHWYCLSDTMWSDLPAAKVMAYRILKTLGSDLLDQLYLEDDLLKLAESHPLIEASSGVIHKDSNGTVLEAGDSVTLIKDLNVKGGGFTAKRGTMVKNISLTDDPKYIEGKVNGVQIVLVAEYLKKA